MRRALSAMFLACALPAAGFAQTLWPESDKGTSFSIEVLKPNFHEGEGGNDTTTFLTSAWFFTARFPMSEGFALHAEVPFSHYGDDVTDSNINPSNTIGNPYLGVSISSKDRPLSFELGARAPLVKGDDESSALAAISGVFTDFVDRAEAFTPDTLPIVGMADYHPSVGSGWSLRLRAGGLADIPVRNDSSSESGDRSSELYALYGAQLWYQPESGSVRIGGGVTGRFLATESGSLGDRTVHELVVGGDVKLGQVRPGLEFRLPLDSSLNDFVDFTVGARLGIEL
jgi:hypothetical protein